MPEKLATANGNELTDGDFQEAFNRVERYIESRYGIPVSISDVIDPNTGDFDGASIQVDYDQDLEIALFVLIHLFGHTVQWNLSDSLRHLGQRSQIGGKTEQELIEIYEYERDATRYSLALLHAVGVYHLDRWVSDYFYADWAFLAHFYRTGEKLDVRTLLRPCAGEVLSPLPIPEFLPQRWVSRWSF